MFIFLMFIFVGLNSSFLNEKTKSHIVFEDAIIAYVTIGGIEYKLLGKWPNETTVTAVKWNYGMTHPLGGCGFFYVNDANLLCANLNFEGPNGNVTYVGLVYQ